LRAERHVARARRAEDLTISGGVNRPVEGGASTHPTCSPVVTTCERPSGRGRARGQRRKRQCAGPRTHPRLPQQVQGAQRDAETFARRRETPYVALGTAREHCGTYLGRGCPEKLSLGTGPGTTLCGYEGCPHYMVALLRGKPGRWAARAGHS